MMHKTHHMKSSSYDQVLTCKQNVLKTNQTKQEAISEDNVKETGIA